VTVLVLLFVLVVSFVQAAVSIQGKVTGQEAVQKVAERQANVTHELKRLLEDKGVEVTESPDGNIVLDENLPFEMNSDQFEEKSAQKVDQLLDKLASSISTMLHEPDIVAGLQMILIEGHTAFDEVEAYKHWNLSSERAQAVVLALQQKNAELAQPALAKYLGAAGRAYYAPLNEKNPRGAENRRVEIRIVLKDDGLKDALDAMSRQP
jgi:flagellar motor protein MotB